MSLLRASKSMRGELVNSNGLGGFLRVPVWVFIVGCLPSHRRKLGPRAQEECRESPPEGFEVVELFLGLRRDPREMGFQGENYWIFESFDHDEIYARRNDLLHGRAAMAYLSFPSLKDPRPNGTPRRLLPHSPIAPWKHIAMNPGTDAARTTNLPRSE
jgi:hypothetical protein